MRKPDRLLHQLNDEWERERGSFQLGAVVFPSTRRRTVDHTLTGRDAFEDPLGLYRVLRGRAA